MEEESKTWRSSLRRKSRIEGARGILGEMYMPSEGLRRPERAEQ
jgi:hypothetical protein